MASNRKRSTLTRRNFLQLLGVAGGSAAVFSAMNAWDLIPAAAQETPPDLEGGGNGTRIIILGAGPAGLVSGYELSKKGYDVKILEASDRVAGHVFTVRSGTEIVEMDGTKQVAEFDEGHFFDAGAWRIPYSHRALLHYCKEFNIPLIPHKNKNQNAYTYLDSQGKKMRNREWLTDMQGYTSELLAKAVDQNNLDMEMSDEDAQMLLDYIVSAGFISSDDLTYSGSSRRGYAELPGGGMNPGEPSEPVPFEELLPFGSQAMQTAGYYMAVTAAFDQQETMLQPAEGMSTIYELGFHPHLWDRIDLQSEVTEIRQSEDGVRIVYTDREFGTTKEITGDYCICTIPLPVLKQIPSDFSDNLTEAIENIPYLDVGKSGLQFGRRFWEEDDWIYGGITFTDIPEIGTIAYPDYNYQSDKGVIQAYYNFGDAAARVGDMSPEERVQLALDQGGKIHPQYEDEFENGVAVAWQKMPYKQGGWATYSQDTRDQYYDRLFDPDGRIYLAGGLHELSDRLAGRRDGSGLDPDPEAPRARRSGECVGHSSERSNPLLRVRREGIFDAVVRMLKVAVILGVTPFPVPSLEFEGGVFSGC
ncbi:MAG: flavin monoamine oxidase family protein [Thermomicrobiales bacterium]